MMIMNEWLDVNMSLIYGRKVRIINAKTRKGVGDMYILYMNSLVKDFKVTKRFLFIFI